MKTIIYCLLLASLASCNSGGFSEKQLQEVMGSRFRNKIEIPERIELVNPQSQASATSLAGNTGNDRYKIIHFFTADCEKCVEELTKAQVFINTKGKLDKLDYYFIASGPTVTYVRDAIEKSGFSKPVYFEKKYFSFKLLNQLPIDSNQYNTMLLNSRNELLLFGAFFDNEKAQEFLYKTIKQHI
jgi:hypothetical protein